MGDTLRRRGWMEKAGKINSAWKRRWFESEPDGEHGGLVYREKPGCQVKGRFELQVCLAVRPAVDSAVVLELDIAGRLVQLRCDSAKEREEWLEVLRGCACAMHAGVFREVTGEPPDRRHQRLAAWEAWRGAAAPATEASTDGEAQYNFSILGATISRSVVINKNTEFEFETRFTNGGTAGAVKCATVSRRFKEFRELHSAIRLSCPGLDPPAMSAGSGAAALRRELGLAKYLKALCAAPGSGRNLPTLIFLGLVKPAMMDSADEVRLLCDTEPTVLYSVAEKSGWLLKKGSRLGSTTKRRWAVLVSATAVRSQQCSITQLPVQGQLLAQHRGKGEFLQCAIDMTSDALTLSLGQTCVASPTGMLVGEPKSARSGHEYCFRVDLAMPDSTGCTKYIFSCASADEKTHWMSSLAGHPRSGNAAGEETGPANRWLLHFEDKDSKSPSGASELPAEGYTVSWSLPPSAAESTAAGAMGMGGQGASTKPDELKIDLNILSGMDKGNSMSLMFETEEQFLSWLITLRSGACTSAGGSASSLPVLESDGPSKNLTHLRGSDSAANTAATGIDSRREPPRNPLPYESSMLDALSEQLPPRGSFDSESLEDVALLRDFWARFHGFDGGAVPEFERAGEGWKDAGFQQRDPVSDLRACGRLALTQLCFFLRHYPEVCIPMCKKQVELGNADVMSAYPWATAGVTVTKMLCALFELTSVPGVTSTYRHARRPFWACVFGPRSGLEGNTAASTAADEGGSDHFTTFHMLYCLFFEYLDREYTASGGTYLTFPSVTRRVRHALLDVMLECSQDPLALARKLGSAMAGTMEEQLRTLAQQQHELIEEGVPPMVKVEARDILLMFVPNEHVTRKVKVKCTGITSMEEMHASISSSLSVTIPFLAEEKPFFLSQPTVDDEPPTEISNVLDFGIKAKVMLWPVVSSDAGQADPGDAAPAFSFLVTESSQSAGVPDGTRVRILNCASLSDLKEQAFDQLGVSVEVASKCFFECFDEDFEEWFEPLQLEELATIGRMRLRTKQ